MTTVALDIYNEKSQIDLSKLRKVTGAKQQELAEMLGLSIETIKANKGSAATVKKAKPLIYALKLLAKLCDNSSDKMRAWFLDPKVYWGGLTPLDMFILKRGEAVVETLKAIKEGEALIGS